jgi:uncharacterized membrane protein YeaQ/YmgE (transglycosylase-associated protein family)
MVTFIIVLVIVGLIAGAIARLLHSFHLVGIIGSIIGAFVLLLLLRLFRVEPGRRY